MSNNTQNNEDSFRLFCINRHITSDEALCLALRWKEYVNAAADFASRCTTPEEVDTFIFTQKPLKEFSMSNNTQNNEDSFRLFCINRHITPDEALCLALRWKEYVNAAADFASRCTTPEEADTFIFTQKPLKEFSHAGNHLQ